MKKKVQRLGQRDKMMEREKGGLYIYIYKLIMWDRQIESDCSIDAKTI